MSVQTIRRLFSLRFAGITLLTAAAYFAFGWLGLYFSVPPGFATSIWPSAGIALAVLIIFGRRYWFAVWLGSALTNLFVSYEASMAIITWSSFLIACFIGLGSALQALIGATVIRRVVGSESALSDVRSIIWYTSLAGPVVCLFNASFSLCILWLFNIVTLDNISHQWLMWWAGDVIGVLVFSPLVMALFAKPRNAWKHRLYSVSVPLMCVFSIFFFVLVVLQRYEIDDAGKTFKHQTRVVPYLIKKSFNDVKHTLISLQSFYDASENVTRNEFGVFTNRALLNNPGIQALSWNPVVRNLERQSYVARARNSGFPNFEFKSIDGDRIIKSAVQSMYIPVFYISPYKGNEAALGYDLLSNKSRLETLKRVAVEDRYLATPRVNLVQNVITHTEKANYSVILFAPLYKKTSSLATKALWGSSIIGYLSAVVDINKIISGVFNSAENETFTKLYLNKEYSISLYDLTAGKDESLLYSDDIKVLNPAVMNQLQGSVSFSYKYMFGGRTWSIRVQPTEQYLNSVIFWRSWAALLCTLLVIYVFHAFLLVLSGQNIAIKKSVDEKTRELQESKVLLGVMAHNDGLTGLPNRKSFYSHLESVLENASVNNAVFAVCFMDLDNFKQVNDSLGHDVGDVYLQAVSDKLRMQVRTGDYIARVGGDEFALCITGIDSVNDLHPILQRYKTAFSHSMIVKSSEIYSSFSVGVSVYPEGGSTVEELVKHADIAMYKAKNNGKNTYAFFDEEIGQTIRRRHTIDMCLRTAIERDEFTVVYQPIVNLTDLRICGAEALLRWKSERLGNVSPEEFIGVAESSGMIGQITLWVIERAGADFSKIDAVLGSDKFYVSVNMSPQLLEQDHFLAAFYSVIEESAINTENLLLEITEKVLVKNPENTIKKMNDIRDVGIKFALDDFGTGYSSMQHLKKLPLSLLKIDQGFVRDICTDENDAAIVKATIQMAHSLGIPTLAEGVETKEQLAYLLEQNCEFVQGYLFARPLILKDLLKIVAKGNVGPNDK